MPPIRRQEIRPDGFLVESMYGTVEVTITHVGNQYTFTYFEDGIQLNQISSNNPSPAQVETWANDRLSTFVQGRFGFALHVFTLNPLNLIIMSLNEGMPIPANWWL